MIRNIIMYVADNFGTDVALEKLDELEKGLRILEDHPEAGEVPRYAALRRKGYRVLIVGKDLVFYKADSENKKVVIYAVFDQRQDYLRIIREL